MILNAVNINKSFGEVDILKSATLLINENEKVAIVGINGAGKTTLLKILAGVDNKYTGDVIVSKDTKIGYLKQINEINSNLTILDEMLTVIKPILDMESEIKELEHQMKHLKDDELQKVFDKYSILTHKYELLDGYAQKSKITGILKGLGFSEAEFDKNISNLSGGQKTRVFLGKLLLSEPDIIILDEPTNHLDLSSIQWLETYLLNYKKTVIIVSHDRYFLDKIVGKVIDIDNTTLTTYTGNYSDFVNKKSALLKDRYKAYLNQQKEIKIQETSIEKLKSFNREKSVKRAESKQKMLDKIELIEKPSEVNTDMKLRFNLDFESGNDVLTVTNLSKSYGNQTLFKNLDFAIKKGEKVAIMGDNGTGKTTILKIINDLVSADTGEIKIGSNVEISYYDQEHQILSMEKTLFDEIQDDFPNLDNTKVRNILASFLFTKDDVYKKIGDLSGGERGRISLAKLMLKNSNLIIMDEPTNHLDMISKNILEEAITSYNGTVIYVSHDRYFINKTANRILELKQNTLLNYIGNYDYYLEKKDDVEKYQLSKESISNNKENKSSSNEDWLAQKNKQSKLKKLQNTLKKCEDEIHKTEKELSDIDEEFLKPDIQSNVSELIKLQNKKDELDKHLESLLSNWEELLVQLDEYDL